MPLIRSNNELVDSSVEWINATSLHCLQLRHHHRLLGWLLNFNTITTPPPTLKQLCIFQLVECGWCLVVKKYYKMHNMCVCLMANRRVVKTICNWSTCSQCVQHKYKVVYMANVVAWLWHSKIVSRWHLKNYIFGLMNDVANTNGRFVWIASHAWHSMDTFLLCECYERLRTFVVELNCVCKKTVNVTEIICHFSLTPMAARNPKWKLSLLQIIIT